MNFKKVGLIFSTSLVSLLMSAGCFAMKEELNLEYMGSQCESGICDPDKKDKEKENAEKKLDEGAKKMLPDKDNKEEN